jgi:hypothetical protein
VRAAGRDMTHTPVGQGTFHCDWRQPTRNRRWWTKKGDRVAPSTLHQHPALCTLIVCHDNSGRA